MSKKNISGKNYNINLEINSSDVLKELTMKKEKILYAWGLKWQSIATKIITANRIVDTGRLRGSLTFSTPSKNGDSISKSPYNKSNDYITSTEKDTLTVGSNVEYAMKQELSNPKGPFIKPSILFYKDSYKILAETILKE